MSKNRPSKLTENDVRLIRQLLEQGAYHRAESLKLSHRRIAEKFGVHQSTIGAISNNTSWYRLR